MHEYNSINWFDIYRGHAKIKFMFMRFISILVCLGMVFALFLSPVFAAAGLQGYRLEFGKATVIMSPKAENTEAATPTEQTIAVYIHPVSQGKTLHLKVETTGIKAERVSAMYGKDKVKLYSAGQNICKGDFDLLPAARVGEHILDVYIADSDGHLYKETTVFNVEQSPAAALDKAALEPEQTNAFNPAFFLAFIALALGGGLVYLRRKN